VNVRHNADGDGVILVVRCSQRFVIDISIR